MSTNQEMLALLESFRNELYGPSDFVSLHEPLFIGNEAKYVQECINTGWVSTVGSYVTLFEKLLAEKTSSNYCVSTNSGTSALHLALIGCGVEAGEEVFLPSFNFVAAANAIRYLGAVPHFVDSDINDMGIDINSLKGYLQKVVTMKSGLPYNRHTGRRIRSIIAVHMYGFIGKIGELIDLVKSFNINLVEDAAEALGSTKAERHAGTFADFGVLSFNGNKTITTGGGGAVLIRQACDYERLKHLSTTAKVSNNGKFEHDQLGYNYRLPNINAALGCAQLEQLNKYLIAKRKIADIYREICKNSDIVEFVNEPADNHSNYWLCTLMFRDSRLRDEFIKLANAQNIMTRPGWSLLSDFRMFQNCPGSDLESAKALATRSLNIPSSPKLSIP